MRWPAPYCPRVGRSRQFCSSSFRGLHILFMGRDRFSCTAFEVLHAAKDVWSSVHVATTPDQRIGRGRKEVSVSPLKSLAEGLNVPVIEIPQDPNTFASWQPPGPFNADFSDKALVTASFGRAIPNSTLSLFEPSLRLNIHPSLLPKFRGAAPIQRTIIKGEPNTGVTILQMEDIAKHGFDAGPIWAQCPVNIPKRTNYEHLEKLLADEGGKLLVQILRHRTHGPMHATAQDHSLATRARLITVETARVRWDRWSSDKVERVFLAIGHQRALHTLIVPTGMPVKLHDVKSVEHAADISKLHQPGDAMYDPSSRRLLIQCQDKTVVSIGSLQSENRRISSAHEWWNGVKPLLRTDGVLRFRSDY